MTSRSPTPEHDAERAVLLLTAWHFARMRPMPRMFWRVRRLERQVRREGGCLHVHRWVSRRSLLLTSYWRSAHEARAWLESPAFRGFDLPARALPGTRSRVELYEAAASASA